MIAVGAAELFSTKGYMETSMEEVASRANLSKGGMYHYFSSKEEILYYILSNFMDGLLDGFEREIERIDDPVDKIRYIIRHHVHEYVAHTHSAKALFNEAYNLASSKLAKIKSKERQYFAVIAGVLSSYLRQRLDKDELTVVTFSLLGMCNWIYSWYNPQGIVDPDELSRIIFENFMRGLSSFQKGSC